MSTALVYAVFGDLVLSPTNATTGGTVLGGLDADQAIRLSIPHGVVTRRFGLRRDKVRSRARMVQPPAFLICPVMGKDVDSVKLRFAAHSIDGVSVVSSGANALLAGRQPLAVPALIRPRVATEDYIYFPALQLHTETEAFINRSPAEFHQYADTALILLPGVPQLKDIAAVTVGSASVVNAAIASAA
jgi:hypothetical protein